MTTAKSSLISFMQDGRMLSCGGRFISIMVCCINFNLIVICLVLAGIFGFTIFPAQSNKINAMEFQTAQTLQNEKINRLEAKAVKYAKFKLSYPDEGIIHAKGSVPVGNKTVRVNILEIDAKINKNLEIKPATASYELNSRVKIQKIADKNNALAAVNGGYFKPQTGVPLGLLVIDNELLTGPVYNRVAMGINPDNTYSMGKSEVNFSLVNKKINFKIDNVNQPRMLSTYSLLYTEKWGKFSPPPPKYGLNAVISDGKITGIFSTAVEIPSGGYVLSAPVKSLDKLKGQKNLKLSIQYPEYFKNSVHIISGGPYLVRGGEIFIDTQEEKLTAISGRNPRTLIGYTKNNELILVTVDGREETSVGMSLYEAAKFMQKLGCVNAMNLDGGSSSVMYLKGHIINTPPISGGIPLSGALTVSSSGPVALSGNKMSEM